MSKFSDEIIGTVGSAVSILYGLDIKLSNMYTGDREHKVDKAIKEIRKQVGKALSELETHKWVSNLEAFEGEE